MGQFKDVGNPELALIEELSEAIQVISKKIRFGGLWNEIPEGKTLTRWQQLESEMEDVMYQWERVKEFKAADDDEDALFDKFYKMDLAQRALANPEDFGLV